MPIKNNPVSADQLQKFSYPEIKTPQPGACEGFRAYKENYWSYLSTIPPTTASSANPEAKTSLSRSERMAKMRQHSQFMSAPATGWKFQISLDDSNPQNVEDAWNKAILPVYLNTQ
ncbi:hypothetical protein [Legionella tunisiensis]|uniref:hypothetical protein n=1 Tax=Legionella tunisiensis TaxID=1034944 RepID=UPI00030D4922|nr:hypothetical protein [Legionella tunisiensis]